VRRLVADVDRGGGRFGPSLYDLGGLVDAVADVTRYANPTRPDAVSTRAFNRTCAAAGHPSCPTAKVICYERLLMGWPELKKLALDPDRCVDRTLGSRFAEGDGAGVSESELRLALRTVAARLGASTISGAEYMRELAVMLASDRRCYRHGRRLSLPTEAQILVAARTWAHALALAGLDPLERERSQTVPVAIVDALDLFAAEYGYVATTHELEGFALQRGFPLARRRRPYAEEIAELRALRTPRGDETPDRRPSKADRPVFERGGEARGNRRKKRWSDDELVAALVAALDLMPPRGRLTLENYRRHCAHRPGFPPASAFTRRGRRGFAAYRESARAQRREAAAAFGRAA
jgi:hypothetical protein